MLSLPRFTDAKYAERPSDERTDVAGVVAGAGPLHLDHAGAEVGEHHRGVRPGEHAGEVDDDRPLKRPAR